MARSLRIEKANAGRYKHTVVSRIFRTLYFVTEEGLDSFCGEGSYSGNIREKHQPNGHTITKTYDALNRTAVITGPDGTDTPTPLALYKYENTYDQYGNVFEIAESYPSADAELTGRTVTNTYDGANRLTVEAVLDSTGLTTTTYTCDGAHNRLSKLSTHDDGLNPVQTLENLKNVYNNLNQLLYSFEDTDSDDLHDTGEPRTSYLYDDNGNRIEACDDADGDYIVDSGGMRKRHIYDYENRLTNVYEEEVVNEEVVDSESYTYAYDYRTRRVLRDESNAATSGNGKRTYIVFSGGLSIQEWEEDGTATNFQPAGDDTLEVEYVRGSDYGGGVGGILYTRRGTVGSFNHYNSRGDVVAKVDDSGTLEYQAAYEAFGQHDGAPGTQSYGNNPDRQQHSTKDEDGWGGINMHHRYYDPVTGVFMTRDPLGFVDGPNMYAYVVQNPWTKFDPLGLQEKKKEEKKKNSNDDIGEYPFSPPSRNDSGSDEAHKEKMEEYNQKKENWETARDNNRNNEIITDALAQYSGKESLSDEEKIQFAGLVGVSETTSEAIKSGYRDMFSTEEGRQLVRMMIGMNIKIGGNGTQVISMGNSSVAEFVADGLIAGSIGSRVGSVVVNSDAFTKDNNSGHFEAKIGIDAPLAAALYEELIHAAQAEYMDRLGLSAGKYSTFNNALEGKNHSGGQFLPPDAHLWENVPEYEAGKLFNGFISGFNSQHGTKYPPKTSHYGN